MYPRNFKDETNNGIRTLIAIIKLECGIRWNRFDLRPIYNLDLCTWIADDASPITVLVISMKKHEVYVDSIISANLQFRMKSDIYQ